VADLGDDLLIGAAAIAGYMFGAGTKHFTRTSKTNVSPERRAQQQRIRAVYHLHEKSERAKANARKEGLAVPNTPPIWKDGNELVSRRTLLDRYYNPPVMQEGDAAPPIRLEALR
jgi:hypothetical protein